MSSMTFIFLGIFLFVLFFALDEMKSYREEEEQIEILKNDELYFAHMGISGKRELTAYLGRNFNNKELTKKLQRQIANNDRYIKRIERKLNSLQKKKTSV